jgi:hypothetical protein
LRQLQGFHDHTLSRERRISVNQNRQNALALFITAALLASAH